MRKFPIFSPHTLKIDKINKYETIKEQMTPRQPCKGRNIRAQGETLGRHQRQLHEMLVFSDRKEATSQRNV